MVWYEIKKIMHKRITLLSVCALLFAPALFLLFSMYSAAAGDAFKPSSYRQLYQELAEGGDVQLEDQLNNLWFQTGGTELLYTASVPAEYELLSLVKQELEQTEQYQEYVQGVLSDTRRGGTISLFTKTRSMVRNAELTAKDFERMTDLEVQPAPLHGMTLFFTTDWTELLYVVAMLLLVAEQICSELEEGKITLLRSCRKGGSSMALRKYFACLGMLELGFAVMYVLRFLIVVAAYGAVDLTLPVQCVYGARSCTLRFSIAQMVICFFAFKSLIYAVLLAFLCFLGFTVQKTWKLYLWTGVIFLVSWIGYSQISEVSYLVNLKWINPVAVLFTEQVLLCYRNLLFFGYPFHYMTVMLLVSICMLAACIVGMCIQYRYSRKKVFQAPASMFFWLEQHVLSITASRTLVGYEFRKWSFYQSGLAICLLVLCVICLCPFHLSESLYTYNDIYYRNYVQEYRGEWTQEKQELLEQEYELLLAQWTSALASEETSESEIEYYRMEVEYKEGGLLKTISYGEYLSEKAGGSFIYEMGYLILLGQGQGIFPLRVYRMVAAVLMVVLTSFLFAMEKQNGMKRLYRCTLTGERRIYFRKWMNMLLIGSIIACVVYIPWCLHVCAAFSLQDFGVLAYSVEALQAMPSWLTLGEVIAVFYLAHLLYLWLVGGVMQFICRKVSRYPVQIALGAVLAVFPILIF